MWIDQYNFVITVTETFLGRAWASLTWSCSQDVRLCDVNACLLLAPVVHMGQLLCGRVSCSREGCEFEPHKDNFFFFWDRYCKHAENVQVVSLSLTRTTFFFFALHETTL